MGQNNDKKGGVVVNMASISGLDPIETAPIYSGIKHGVVGLTKAFGVWDRTFASNNVTVNRSGVEWEESLHALQTSSDAASFLVPWASNHIKIAVNF